MSEGRAAAAKLFCSHLGSQCSHRGSTEANVDEALSLYHGLAIAIATLPAPIWNTLVRRVISNVLGQVAGNHTKHQGLFTALRETLEFLDRQPSATNEVDSESQGVMTRTYASLHSLNRSEN